MRKTMIASVVLGVLSLGFAGTAAHALPMSGAKPVDLPAVTNVDKVEWRTTCTWRHGRQVCSRVWVPNRHHDRRHWR
jgi:uncharacterized protein YcfJ